MSLSERFFDLYGGLDRAFGSYQVGETNERNKVGGKAQTIADIYHAQCWGAHLSGEKGLGVVPITDEGTCNWGAIDIDVYPLDLSVLEKKIRERHLPLTVIRTKSGGAHLTLFMNRQVPASLIRNRLIEFGVALGYGGVEIFPKQVRLANKKDTGNWLNMPYFDAKKTLRYAILDGKPLSAEEFLDLAVSRRLTRAQLEDLEINLPDTFADGPPCLQAMALNGVPEGSRNNSLFAMGVYCKIKYQDGWEFEIDKLNSLVMSPPLATRDVQMVVKSLGRKEYFYPCNKPPLVTLCNRDLCRKREFGVGELENQDVGVNIGDLVKILTDPPMWFLDVEGFRIELDTEDLLSQDKFRRLCVAAINKLPGRIKVHSWEKLVREKLENVQIQQAPVESGVKGRTAFMIEQFFNTTPPAKMREEILLGRHWTENGMTYFRGTDLIRYLETQGLRIDPRKIWSAISDLKGSAEHISIKGRTVAVWGLKSWEDESMDYPTPPMPDFKDSFGEDR